MGVDLFCSVIPPFCLLCSKDPLVLDSTLVAGLNDLETHNGLQLAQLESAFNVGM